MASNTPNNGAPLSPAEVKDWLASLSNNLETYIADNSKLSKKLQDGLMQQKYSEDKLWRKLEASTARVVELENEIVELKKGMSGTCLELRGKIGQVERRILGIEDARHVEQPEQSSNATGNMVIKEEGQ